MGEGKVLKSVTVEAVRGIIAKSKKGKEKELHLFTHVPHLKTVQAYKETLLELLTRCHHPWNPEEDLDPLVGFGAEEGLLPGLNQVQTMPFCDMIIRWMEPHQNLDRQSLEDYTLLLCAIKLSLKDVELMLENGKSCFTLHYRILMHTYKVMLGISKAGLPPLATAGGVEFFGGRWLDRVVDEAKKCMDSG